MDLTNTWRSTNAGTSLQTNFGSIPYLNTPQGHVTENNLTNANSRVGLRVDTKVKDWNVLGYWESDFVGGIGNAAFNTQVSSNSLIFASAFIGSTYRKGSLNSGRTVVEHDRQSRELSSRIRTRSFTGITVEFTSSGIRPSMPTARHLSATASQVRQTARTPRPKKVQLD